MKHTLTVLTALLLAPLAALPAAEPLSTFCNPLPTPNYPVGFLARSVTHGEPEARQGWILGKPLPARSPEKSSFLSAPAPKSDFGRDRKKQHECCAPAINKCSFLRAPESDSGRDRKKQHECCAPTINKCSFLGASAPESDFGRDSRKKQHECCAPKINKCSFLGVMGGMGESVEAARTVLRLAGRMAGNGKFLFFPQPSGGN